MTEEDFEAYLDGALDELEAKQTHLMAEYDLGKRDLYHLDYETGKIQFLDGDTVSIEASFTPVGKGVSDSAAS